MGSCPVFKWARAVLSPHYLSRLPATIDRIAFLTEIASSLKLTADVTSDINSPALQGEWEDIIRAQIKLLGFLSECQVNLDKNVKQAHQKDVSIVEQVETDEIIDNRARDEDRSCGNLQLEVVHESGVDIDKDASLTIDNNSIQEVEIFSKGWKEHDSTENFSIEIKSGDSLSSGSDVRNVFVIANDYEQLELLPSIARSVSSQSKNAIANVNNQNEPITTFVDGTQSQLIFVTGAILESGDKTTEDVCEKVEDELYMNIVLAPRKESLKPSGDNAGSSSNSSIKENPLDKLCQLLRIDEDEAGEKRCEELERKRRYENNLPFKYFCSQCSFKTKRENHYLKHLKLHEKHKVLYRCSKCQFTTIRVGMLRRHELHHNEGRLLNCKHCSYKTDSMKLLSKHTQTRHSPNKRPLKCCNCAFKTGSLRELNNHKHIHDPVKPKEFWECNQCSYKTQNKGHLVRHKNDVHGLIRPFLCHHCGKSFKRHDTLKQHKVIHGEVSSNHACTECNKVCRTSAQLKDHMTVHSTQRPFLCELCGATFKTRSIQCRHVKKMHSNASLQCSFCKQHFSNKSGLMKHVEMHKSVVETLVVESGGKTL